VGLASALATYLLVGHVRSARQESAIAEYADEIFRSPSSYVAGNREGDVSVAAFFDYNCPYCRKDAPALLTLIASDPKVRLVLKELPVLGDDSEAAARIALAAQAQGKYFELYHKLITERGRATKAKALHLAAGLGLDTAKLERDSQGPAIAAALEENKRLRENLGIRGVPFYLVGDQPVAGSDKLYDELVATAADIRKNGCRGKC
jgi:protein-disulfide isomerase